MNTLTYLFRTTLLTAVSLIAIGALLNPQSMRAQEVLAGSATGAETQTGDGATATGSGALAGGTGSTASGAFAVALGNPATASGAGSLAVGFATATGANSVAMGNNSVNTPTTADGANSVAIGVAANTTVAASSSVAIGESASTSAANTVAIGSFANAGFTNSTAIGAGATTTRANQMAFGTGSNTYTMAGITSAASTAAQSGPTQFVTTDLNGNLASLNLAPVFGHLRNRIENTRSQEQGGIALAIATANLRYDDRPGKMSVAGGLGGFQHEGGGSLGLGYTAPNQRVRFNVSAGGSTHGDFGGGGGLSITLN